MPKPPLNDCATPELRFELGESFDLDSARECLRQCRKHKDNPPQRLVFDLSRTRFLQTAGIGLMLHLHSEYRIRPGASLILYRDQVVGNLLRLAHLELCFELCAVEHPQHHGNEANTNLSIRTRAVEQTRHPPRLSG